MDTRLYISIILTLLAFSAFAQIFILIMKKLNAPKFMQDSAFAVIVMVVILILIGKL